MTAWTTAFARIRAQIPGGHAAVFAYPAHASSLVRLRMVQDGRIELGCRLGSRACVTLPDGAVATLVLCAVEVLHEKLFVALRARVAACTA